MSTPWRASYPSTEEEHCEAFYDPDVKGAGRGGRLSADFSGVGRGRGDPPMAEEKSERTRLPCSICLPHRRRVERNKKPLRREKRKKKGSNRRALA